MPRPGDAVMLGLGPDDTVLLRDDSGSP
jgi:hypothetical protein